MNTMQQQSTRQTMANDPEFTSAKLMATEAMLASYIVTNEEVESGKDNDSKSFVLGYN